MITVNYCKEGTAVSDFAAEEWLINWLSFNDNMVYNVSTENIISWIRVYIAEGKLSIKDVKLQFNGKDIEINEYAVISEWPDGFCDYGEENSARILRATHKRKANEIQDF